MYMEKAMAPHSSTLAWKIPWTEEPGRLQSMGSKMSQTRLSDFTFTFHFHALEKEMATHSCSCLENPRDGGARWAAVYGVAKSRTQLKRLSSSSSSMKRPQWNKVEPVRKFLLREANLSFKMAISVIALSAIHANAYLPVIDIFFILWC